MEKKHLIMAVAAILLLAVAAGLLLPYLLNREQPPVATDPTVQTTVPMEESSQPTTQPQETTVPVEETTAPTEETTAPTQAPTEATTAPTEPAHVHSFEKKQTVAATLEQSGYTVYTCKSCGYSYRGDVTVALTLQQVINSQSLTPTATGIAALDTLVNDTLAQILPANATNYEKLTAIYDHLLSAFSTGSSDVDPGKAAKLADGKVFRSVSELLFSYEAYQLLTQKQGVADHYAALFCVLTRAAGFESYVVTGSRDGSSHVWNNVRIDGKLYAFDAYAPTETRFALADGALSGYVYSNRDSAIAAQSGFRAAEPFTVKLTYTDNSGTTTVEFTWSAADMRSGTANFMKNTPSVIRAKGTVTYTLEVTAGSGSFLLINEKGEAVTAKTISGTLASGAGYHTLQAEEEQSMMHFDIRIDN